MKDTDNNNERINFENEDYYDRSGCGKIAAALVIIILFWIVVAVIGAFA